MVTPTTPSHLQAPPGGSLEAIYIVYNARFHMLAIYCALLLCNAAFWVALASLAPREAKDFFGVGK